MPTRLYRLLLKLTRFLRRYLWCFVALTAGSLLPDALKIFHSGWSRGWEHSITWITAGLLGFSISVFLVGLAITYLDRQSRNGVLK